MFNKKAILIGFFLVILLTGIFIRLAGSLSGYMEYLIASIIVGFIVGESIMNGMFNGIVVNLIGGITALIIIALLQGNPEFIELIFIFIISVFIMIIMGIIGGATGSLLKRFINSLTNLPDNQGRGVTTNPPEKQIRYLKCKSCKGEYILEPDELPGDFESCSCGGELEFYDAHGRKRPYTTTYHRNRKKTSLGTKILILIVAGLFILYLIFPLIMIFILENLGPSGGIYFFPIFFGLCIAAIIILIWYAFIRK